MAENSLASRLQETCKLALTTDIQSISYVDNIYKTCGRAQHFSDLATGCIVTSWVLFIFLSPPGSFLSLLWATCPVKTCQGQSTKMQMLTPFYFCCKEQWPSNYRGLSFWWKFKFVDVILKTQVNPLQSSRTTEKIKPAGQVVRIKWPLSPPAAILSCFCPWWWW